MAHICFTIHLLGRVLLFGIKTIHQLFTTKPLSEPVLAYHSLNQAKAIQLKFDKTFLMHEMQNG